MKHVITFITHITCYNTHKLVTNFTAVLTLHLLLRRPSPDCATNHYRGHAATLVLCLAAVRILLYYYSYSTTTMNIDEPTSLHSWMGPTSFATLRPSSPDMSFSHSPPGKVWLTDSRSTCNHHADTNNSSHADPTRSDVSNVD